VKAVMKYLLTGMLLATGTSAAEMSVNRSSSTDTPQDCVVLLHGLGRTGLSMKRVEWFLARHGYRVANITYPSLRVPMEQLADKYLDHALARRVPAGAGRVHFVTHSMGGILLRQYLATHCIENLGCVVMLAPPNRESEQVDRFKRFAFARWIAGPNFSRLGTGPQDLPQKLGPADFEVGVIAGDRPLPSWLRRELNPSDGKVTVESAKLAGMKDFTVVHCSHTFMMCKRESLQHVSEFIQYGRFFHSEE
jgi:triacylglycerol lipase